MNTFLPFIFVVLVKLSVIQAQYENYNGARSRQFYPDPYNQKDTYQSRQKPVTKFETPVQDESEIFSAGNGYNRRNVAIINGGSRRNFQESEDRAFLQPKYGVSNTNQRPKYDSNVISVSNIGNRNSVVIENSADGLDATIGYGPENRNTIVINDKVYSNAGGAVLTRRDDGYIRSETKFDTPVRDSNRRHQDDSEIFSFGNGQNRKNVVVLNEGSRRNFQENEDRELLKPRYGVSNTNQRPNYGSRVNYIGNGYGNRNSVVIRDSTGGLDETIVHNEDNPRVNYNNIGRGPNNRNLVVINGKVYSDPGTTVITRKDGDIIRSEVISDNRYHRYPNEDNLKVLPRNA